ncbi:hypothetical protein AB1K54_11000 [Microbacterium sp. BWT-B31]|uniref:glycosyl hydrolase family 95 catalytic domain-containing protein n=1 Tax=Microbacterium sp. BWT-B31 TaxID=3232072 RepID=UPI003527C536
MKPDASHSSCGRANVFHDGPDRWSAALGRASPSGQEPPREFFDAPFLGNGALGCFVTIADGSVRIWIDHNLSRDHQPTGGPLWGGSRLPMGELCASLPSRVEACRWRLDLESATLSLAIDGEGWQVAVDVFITAEADAVVVIHRAGEQLEWRFSPAAPTPPRLAFAPQERPADLLDHPVAREVRVDDAFACVQDLAAGGGYVVAWASRHSRTVLCARLASAHEHAADELRHAVAGVHDTHCNLRLRRLAHLTWWRNFFRASYVEVPDALNGFFWIQLYKLASATRAGGAVITTMGPWLTATPWAGAWWNLNVQLSYPLAARTGHHELDSLSSSLRAHSAQLERNTARPGRAAIGRTSQEDLDSELVPPPGTAGAEAGNLLWALHTAVELRETAGDERSVERVMMPLIEAAVETYLDVLEADADGILHLPVTHSPEFADARDANYDLALLTWGLRMLAHGPRTVSARWARTLSMLAPAPADPKEGLLIGENRRLDESHRHYSHLLWFEPLRLLDADDPACARLLLKSLRHWLSMPDALRGYSRTGAASMYAQLGDGDAALAQLRMLTRECLSATTMYRETGPVLETPLAAARALLDLLIDEPARRVRVFPAVPSTWRSARFSDLRVRGGHRVGAERRDGVTVRVQVVAARDDDILIDTDMVDAVVVTGSAALSRGPRGVVASATVRRGDTLVVAAPSVA